jgi:hypothetical protein
LGWQKLFGKSILEKAIAIKICTKEFKISVKKIYNAISQFLFGGKSCMTREFGSF